MLTTILVVLALVGVGALAARARIRSGTWDLPTRQELRHLVEKVARSEAKPSRTVYLQRGSLEIHGGADDAKSNGSSLVEAGKSFLVPRYRVSNAKWRRLMRCVEDKFSDYDVRVTDKRPESGDYILVKVGGSPADIGMGGQALGGIAPFNGSAVPNSIVFAFDQRGRKRTLNNCQTVAHELGHVYGLDHTYDCKDIMSYRQCGPKSFVDKPMRCGEHESRPCEDDVATQNSAERLMKMLGPVPRV